MAKITAPNLNYNGASASIKFENGIGYTNDANLISWFNEHGYKVEDFKENKKAKSIENIPLNQDKPNADENLETEKQSESVTEFPEGFPLRAKKVFDKLGKTYKEVSEMSRETLIETRGIAEKMADAIIALRDEK